MARMADSARAGPPLLGPATCALFAAKSLRAISVRARSASSSAKTARAISRSISASWAR